MSEPKCGHEMIDIETAILADELCPCCLEARVKELETELAQAKDAHIDTLRTEGEEVFRLRNRIAMLEAAASAPETTRPR